jgi:hypothetical protein
MKFPTCQVPGGRREVITPLGRKVYETERELHEIEEQTIDEMTRRLSRPPTKAEMVSGPKPADDRTFHQKMERNEWQPKRPPIDPMTRLADSLEAGTTPPDYKGMSLQQRLAADARAIAERNQGNTETDSQRAEKLKRLAGDLRKIDAAIDAENWRAERGSQRVVDLLDMLRIQLVDGSDATETRRLRGELTNLLGERAKQESTASRAAIAALEQQIASIRDGSQLGNLGESDPVRYRAEQLMAEGADSTSAWTTARGELGGTLTNEQVRSVIPNTPTPPPSNEVPDRRKAGIVR